jgi:hypothetical protein
MAYSKSSQGRAVEIAFFMGKFTFFQFSAFLKLQSEKNGKKLRKRRIFSSTIFAILTHLVSEQVLNS